jgi:hypothetical protein
MRRTTKFPSNILRNHLTIAFTSFTMYNTANYFERTDTGGSQTLLPASRAEL